MSNQSRTYLWKPYELPKLSTNDAVHLGLMKEMSHNDAITKARNSLGDNALLICTIEPYTNKKNELQIVGMDQNRDSIKYVIDAYDSCYPITRDEWEQFIHDEKTYCRNPIQLWAVDGSKYTAPI